MGCDIHMFAERKVNDQWKNIEEFEFNDRSYDLFSILADVRNGYGFAGCKTGEGFVPISTPKGLPSDADHAVREKSDDYDCDGHSHSWLTLAEIKAFDWGQLTVKRGIISLDQFKELRESGGKPTDWSGGISGPKIEVVEEHIAEKMATGWSTPDYYKDKRIYVNYHWSNTYADICSWFLELVNGEYSTYGADDDVRFVFFFDN